MRRAPASASRRLLGPLLAPLVLVTGAPAVCDASLPGAQTTTASRRFVVVPSRPAVTARAAACGGGAAADPVAGDAPARAGSGAAHAALVASAPIEVHNNHVFVTVCHGERVLSFILDTGAPQSFLDLTVARELDVRLGKEFRVHGVGAGTVAGAPLVRTAVTLPGSGVSQSVAAAIDFSDIAPREGRRLDGLLGGDLFERFVVRIDYAGRTLSLYDRARFRYEGSGTAVPVTIRDRQPHVEAEVELANGARARGAMLVDVGGSQAFNLAKPWVEKHRLREGITPTVRGWGGSGVGGGVAYDMGRVAAVRLGGVAVSRPIVHLHGDSAGALSRGSAAGTIGGEVLRRYVLVVDYERRQLVFEPHDGTAAPFEADVSGLGLAMDPARSVIVVQRVAEGSSASEAGLAVGDTITAVDGEPADGAMLDHVRTRLLRTPDRRIEFTIRRAGTTERRTLATRRVL